MTLDVNQEELLTNQKQKGNGNEDKDWDALDGQVSKVSLLRPGNVSARDLARAPDGNKPKANDYQKDAQRTEASHDA